MNILKILRNSFSRIKIDTSSPEDGCDGNNPHDLHKQMHQERLNRLKTASQGEREMINKFREMGREEHAEYLLNKYIENQRKIEREREYFRGLGIELEDDEKS